jgi:PKD repeat protein
VPLTAVDGTFNNSIEAVVGTIDTSSFNDGERHTLFVRGQDAVGNWGAISAIYLDISSEAPTAAFSHPNPVAAGHPFTFTNQSTGNNLSYQWDFGDGTTSTQTNPTHIYNQVMSYTVQLTVTNGISIAVANSTVTAIAPATAVFSHPSPIATNTLITFTNQSTGTDISYSWDFGDGGSSSDLNPSHTYTQANTYTVTLTVDNAASSDSSSSLLKVMDLPVADFMAVSEVEAGTAVLFTNLSTGTDISYTWDFDDGSSSTETDPTHTFTTPGTYTVTLTVENALGMAVDTAVIQVIPASSTLYLPFVTTQ